MASLKTKCEVFVRGHKAAIADGYEFVAMSAFVNTYCLEAVPTSSLGNPKALAKFGRECLKTLQEAHAAAPVPSVYEFPDIPDTRESAMTAEQRQEARLEKQKEKRAKQLADIRGATAEINKAAPEYISEAPVNHAGEKASV